MTHIDLFSGIGGFSYALDQIFHEQEIKHIFVENDPFCQAVLKKHWPEADVHGDIRTFTYTKYKRLERSDQSETNSRKNKTGQERTHGSVGQLSNIQDIFLLTGGFPCQPFSQAGVRKGRSDDRYLWPEMLRVIRESRPRWVIAENVAGLLSIENGMVFEQVCSDLEGEGYEVWPFVIPACAVGAPHRRDRVWIVANDRRKYGEQGKYNQHGKDTPKRTSQTRKTERQSSFVSDTESERRTKTGGNRQRPPQWTTEPDHSWERDWKEVAFATCHDRVDDGLSYRMDGITISAARHRKERLKACGNAIVPQVAMKIMEAIKEYEERN